VCARAPARRQIASARVVVAVAVVTAAAAAVISPPVAIQNTVHTAPGQKRRKRARAYGEQNTYSIEVYAAAGGVYGAGSADRAESCARAPACGRASGGGQHATISTADSIDGQQQRQDQRWEQPANGCISAAAQHQHRRQQRQQQRRWCVCVCVCVRVCARVCA